MKTNYKLKYVTNDQYTALLVLSTRSTLAAAAGDSLMLSKVYGFYKQTWIQEKMDDAADSSVSRHYLFFKNELTYLII